MGSRVHGRGSLALVPLAGGPERIVAADPAPSLGRGLGGGCFDWMPDSSGFVYSGAGQVWLHLLDGTRRCLTDVEPGAEVQSPTVSPDGRRVAFTVNLAEVRVVAIDEHDSTTWVFSSHDFVMDPEWVRSDDAEVSAHEVCWVGWDIPHMPWDSSSVVRGDLRDGTWTTVVADHHARVFTSVQQARFARGHWWYVRDTDGWLQVHRDGSAVLGERFEHAGPAWGPGQRSYAVSPDGRRVVLNRNEHGFGRLVVVDMSATTGNTETHVHEIGKGVHAQLHWVGNTITALRTGGRTPTQAVAYHEQPDGSWTRSVLAVGPAVEWGALEHVLVEPELITVTHDDGGAAVSVPARVYRPDRVGPAPDPRTGVAAPRAIVWVHGGPTDQWQVSFLPRIAFWVSRGWTVVVPDHRGSTGHGRAFQQALRHEWGRADAADVAAVIAHVHTHRWATPETTVVMGGSAGGYAALRVLEQFPARVAGAAVVYPVTDPMGLRDSTHRFEAHYTDTLVDVAAVLDGRRTVAVDPALIRRPVLILHGDADPVVPLVQSEALAAQCPLVELVVFPGEGHGFRQYANQLAEYEHLERFLERVTGQ